MAVKDKRYFWLKLKKDFFKRHDIRIIEAMPNGKDYILFYLKLLCESVDHDGNLRFSDSIPYNEDMLATITNTNVDVVRGAISVFTELKMMEIMDDGTYYMSEVNKMIGSETYWAEQKRLERERKALDIVQHKSNESPTCPSKSKSIELEQEQELDKEIMLASVDVHDLFEGFDIVDEQIDDLMARLNHRTKHLRCDNEDEDYFRLYDEMSDLVGIAKERKAKYIYAFLKKVIDTTDFHRTEPDYKRWTV